MEHALFSQSDYKFVSERIGNLVNTIIKYGKFTEYYFAGLTMKGMIEKTLSENILEEDRLFLLDILPQFHEVKKN